jgi:hypothetical protein
LAITHILSSMKFSVYDVQYSVTLPPAPNTLHPVPCHFPSAGPGIFDSQGTPVWQNPQPYPSKPKLEVT